MTLRNGEVQGKTFKFLKQLFYASIKTFCIKGLKTLQLLMFPIFSTKKESVIILKMTSF